MSRPNAGLVIVFGFLCGGTIVDVAGAQTSNELKGDRLSLVDRRGVNRVGVGLFGKNQEYTYFYLTDSRGKKRVAFTVYPDDRAPTLTFYDSNGRAIQARAPGSERAPANFAQIRSRINGQYQDREQSASPGPTADQVSHLQVPVNPSGNVKSWLDAHNLGLRQIIESRFDEQNMRTFTAAEHQQCSANTYCELAFRQQAISILVSR
jgi:hypothetical protein